MRLAARQFAFWAGSGVQVLLGAAAATMLALGGIKTEGSISE